MSQNVAFPAEAAKAESDAPGVATGWRRWAPWALVVLAALIAFVSALNIWVTRQALNTDNWTGASTRLLENDAVRSAVAVYLVDQLYDNVDVGAALEERLPPATKPLAQPLAAALEPALVRATERTLARPRVQAAWQQSNRRAHELFMAVIDGKRGLLVATDDNVVLDLRALLDELVATTGIGQRVADRLPPDAGQIVVMEGGQLHAARQSVKVVRALSYLLSFVMLGLFALAVYLAAGRRRSVLTGIGASVVIVGLLVLVVRRLAGTYLVDALTGNADAERPVSAVWAIETELLRNVGFNAIVYGVLVLLAAWIAGPSRPAVWFRRTAAPTLRDRPVVVFGAVALLLLVVLLTGPTDGQRVLPLLVFFAFAIAGTEVLRRQTAREFPVAT